MSISKRSLIFVFAVVTAFVFLGHYRAAVAQNYSGMDMPGVFKLTPKPYVPTGDLTTEQRKAAREAVNVWKKQGGNSRAQSVIRSGQLKVKEVLEGGGDVTADPKASKFLEDYTFPSMTQTDPDTLSTLGEKRQLFLKNYMSSKVTGVARVKMLEFSIKKLQAYSIDSTLHPSARVNAIVLLSQLTDRPLDRGKGQAPIASANAFKALLSIFNGQDPKKNPEFVKVAALSGIKKQLELNSKSGQSADPAVKDQLVATSLGLMAAPADPDADVAAYWKKRLAVQLSAILKDAKTLPALLAILNDETSRFELKLEVVKAIVKTGAMGSDQKTNSTVLVSICKFAENSVANEAIKIQAEIDQMERDGILYSDTDIRATGVEIDPGGPEDLDGLGGRRGGFDDLDRERNIIPMVELPNYQLQISRNRLRIVTISCGRAIGKLRGSLDAKSETLGRGTIEKLSLLLDKANVGLLPLDERRDPDDPTIEEEDRDRETSYADQMIKVCKDSAEELASLVADFTAETTE